MFSEERTLFISRKAGVSDLSSLIGCVKECGFDETSYLTANADLQTAGLDPASALFHFLAYGVDEHRDLPGGTLADGLAGLTALPMADQVYAIRLFRNLFFGHLENPCTAERLWHAVDGGLIESIRAMGGVPYFIIGDSHTTSYRRQSSNGTEWLAPLPLLCHGGSAIRLAGDDARSMHGREILRWARTTESLPFKFDVPVFLKFGGIDAEFLWVRRRIRKGAYRFSLDEFDAFARESVSRYGLFLDALGNIVDPKLLRVCSVFPSALVEARWAERFLAAHRGTPENDRHLAAELLKTEIPDLTTRNRLRALYNSHLRCLCEDRGLVFVDDFPPFLDSGGRTGHRFLASPGDHHLNYDACEASLVKIIWRHLPH